MASYFDIGANLLAEQFRGKYHGKRYHEADLEAVLARADASGLREISVTAGTLSEARRALSLARLHNSSGRYSTRLHTTVGVHPTNTTQLDPAAPCEDAPHNDAPAHTSSAVESAEGGCGGGGGAGAHGASSCSEDEGAAAGGSSSRSRSRLHKDEYIAELDRVIADGLTDGTVVAVGECGLDYDRLSFAPKDTQLAHFGLHFDLAERHGLPMFLHDRNTGGDFAAVLRANRHRIPGGVVHSFTGTADELATYLELGLDIGINGCSMKTADNVAVAAQVPLTRIHLETDAPWCEIKRTHASHRHVVTTWPSVDPKKYTASAGKLAKGRSEPCTIVQVAEAVAGIKGVPLSEVVSAAYANSRRMFLRR